MTARLEKAMQQLSPEQLRELESYAEALAQRRRDLESGASFNLGWVGKGADLYPEHKTGVEAAHAAAKMRVDAIERSLSK